MLGTGAAVELIMTSEDPSRRGSLAAAVNARLATAPTKPTKESQGRTPSAPSLTKRISQRDLIANLRKFHTRPATSPHATHAMFLQLQEYHDRLEKALASTYQSALKPPPKPLNERDEDTTDSPKRKPPYCRARILQSNRDCFQPPKSELAGGPPPAFSTPVGVKDCVLPSTGSNLYVSFHQTTPRCSEYLYGTNQESARRMRLLDSMASAAGTNASSLVVAKDHFALGPGQYDVPIVKPSGLAAASKFSPSDRFHENYSTDHPGPGQYLTNEALVTPRPTAAVFSQKPRETDLGSIVSPTANVVSSYYYVPESTFAENSQTSHRVGWSRTARFKSHGRHDRALLLKPPKPTSTDYVAKNMLAVLQHQGRHSTSDNQGMSWLTLKRQSSPVSAARRATQATASSASKQLHAPEPTEFRRNTLQQNLRAHLSPRNHADVLVQSWITIAYMASIQMKLVRLHALATILRRIRSLQTHKYMGVTFTAWKKLDVHRSRQYAAQLIIRNAWRLRLWIRIKHKRRHASTLRQFLHGLSFDVRFALSMRRIKRKIVAIQRWWRHVQLMVRAREEALYYKWIAVENRLRLEYINQLPHLQRILTPPAGTVAATSMLGSGSNISGSGSSQASDLQIHRLLNLPDQQRWFRGRFVLTSDGSMRGYALDTNELVVEIRHFRCHYHDVSGMGIDDMGNPNMPIDSRASYTNYTKAVWKPFLMLFRQGAFRFVVITSPSPLPSELLSWKDKLERLMVTNSIQSTSGGSGFAVAAGTGSFSASHSDFSTSMSDLVEVSMQSGILAPTLSSDNRRPSKFQSRVRTIRQRGKSGMIVAEGALSYYVVDLLKDLPKVPTSIVWATIREKLREKRKAFRAEIYRYKLEMFHYQEHQQHVKHMHVLAKFRDFFTLERPHRPHFRSLISNRKMESLIRVTAEQVKITTPSNPRLLLDSTTLKQ